MATPIVPLRTHRVRGVSLSWRTGWICRPCWFAT